MTPSLNIALLDRIRHAGGDFVPWTTLGTDSARVLADVDALASFGFGIEQHPIHGAAYRGPSRRLCPDQIEWNLGTQVIGKKVAVWNRVASTNDLAMQAASSRSNHGLAILAEEQTAGRGSRGRVWTAPGGSSILLSILLFPPPELDDPVWLNAFAASVVACLVQVELDGGTFVSGRTPHDRGPVSVKWPNDVLISGRKVAGILVERGKGTVIGIGINANLAAADFPEPLRQTATSIAAELGRPVDRSALVRELLQVLDRVYEVSLTHGPAMAGDVYCWHTNHVGHEVEVTTDRGVITGRLRSFDLAAGLVVGTSHLTAETIPIGGFSAIRNRPGSTFWTWAELCVWFGGSPDTTNPIVDGPFAPHRST